MAVDNDTNYNTAAVSFHQYHRTFRYMVKEARELYRGNRHEKFFRYSRVVLTTFCAFDGTPPLVFVPCATTAKLRLDAVVYIFGEVPPNPAKDTELHLLPSPADHDNDRDAWEEDNEFRLKVFLGQLGQTPQACAVYTQALCVDDSFAENVGVVGHLNLVNFAYPYTHSTMKLEFMDMLCAMYTVGDRADDRQAAVIHKVLSSSRFRQRIAFTAKELQQIFADLDIGRSEIERLQKIDWIVEMGHLVRKSLFTTFTSVTASMKQLSRAAPELLVTPKPGSTFAQDQLDALRDGITRQNLAFLVGQAGTGKTHLLTAMARAAECVGYCVVGLAFMGSIVQNLRTLLPGCRCATIHSFIMGGAFENDKRYFIIVDEVFTVGLVLMMLLMQRAQRLRFRMVMCGDPFQLTPVNDIGYATALLGAGTGVDPGNLPAWVKMYTMSINKRQGEGSRLADVCCMIRNGQMPVMSCVRRTTQDALLASACSYTGPIELFLDEWLLLASSNKDAKFMCTTIRNRLNPHAVQRVQAQLESDGGTIPIYLPLFYHDLVFCTKNYKIHTHHCRNAAALSLGGSSLLGESYVEVYNGTLGFIELQGTEVYFRMLSGVEVPVTHNCTQRDMADNADDRGSNKVIPIIKFQAAYARTVYKSQGLEANQVGFVGGGVKSRREVYTAVSRCKRQFYYVNKYPNYFEDSVRMKVPETEPVLRMSLRDQKNT